MKRAILSLIASIVIIIMHNYFFDWGKRWLFVLLVSFFLSFAFTHFFKFLATKFKVFDYPNERKLHHKPTPLLGGVAIYLAFTISLVANLMFSWQFFCVFLASSLAALGGFLDDIKGISAKKRLLFQIAASIIVCLFVSTIGIFSGKSGYFLNAIITIIWLVGIANAFNFFDGLDGLATLLAISIASILGFIALRSNQPMLGWAMIAIVGACLGFLPYNLRYRKKAVIFLGDGGSIFLGFLLAACAVMAEWAPYPNRVAALVSPLLVFWIFIFDMIYTTVTRVISGEIKTITKWLEYTGKDHLHHRLLDVLRNEKLATFSVVGLATSIGIGGIIVREAPPWISYLIIAQATLITALISILQIRASRP